MDQNGSLVCGHEILNIRFVQKHMYNPGVLCMMLQLCGEAYSQTHIQKSILNNGIMFV